MHQQWLRNRQAAEYIGLTPGSLKTMRCRGVGPRYRKLGKIVLYRLRDLDDWADRASSIRETADSFNGRLRRRTRGAS